MKNQQVAKKRFLIGMKNILLSTFTFSFLTLSGCQKDEINSLSVNTNTLSIDKEGGSGTFTITTNADSFFFNDTATPEIYSLSLHDALPIFRHSLTAEQFVESAGVILFNRSMDKV